MECSRMATAYKYITFRDCPEISTNYFWRDDVVYEGWRARSFFERRDEWRINSRWGSFTTAFGNVDIKTVIWALAPQWNFVLSSVIRILFASLSLIWQLRETFECKILMIASYLTINEIYQTWQGLLFSPKKSHLRHPSIGRTAMFNTRLGHNTASTPLATWTFPPATGW